ASCTRCSPPISGGSTLRTAGCSWFSRSCGDGGSTAVRRTGRTSSARRCASSVSWLSCTGLGPPRRHEFVPEATWYPRSRKGSNDDRHTRTPCHPNDASRHLFGRSARRIRRIRSCPGGTGTVLLDPPASGGPRDPREPVRLHFDPTRWRGDQGLLQPSSHAGPAHHGTAGSIRG